MPPSESCCLKSAASCACGPPDGLEVELTEDPGLRLHRLVAGELGIAVLQLLRHVLGELQPGLLTTLDNREHVRLRIGDRRAPEADDAAGVDLLRPGGSERGPAPDSERTHLLDRLHRVGAGGGGVVGGARRVEELERHLAPVCLVERVHHVGVVLVGLLDLRARVVVVDRRGDEVEHRVGVGRDVHDDRDRIGSHAVRGGAAVVVGVRVALRREVVRDLEPPRAGVARIREREVGAACRLRRVVGDRAARFGRAVSSPGRGGTGSNRAPRAGRRRARARGCCRRRGVAVVVVAAAGEDQDAGDDGDDRHDGDQRPVPAPRIARLCRCVPATRLHGRRPPLLSSRNRAQGS